MNERNFALWSNTKIEMKQNGMDFQGSPYVLFVTWSCSLQIKKLINILVIQMWLFKVYHTFVVVYSVKVHIIYIYVYHFFSSTKYLIICSNYCTMWFENWNSNLQMSLYIFFHTIMCYLIVPVKNKVVHVYHVLGLWRL